MNTGVNMILKCKLCGRTMRKGFSGNIRFANGKPVCPDCYFELSNKIADDGKSENAVSEKPISIPTVILEEDKAVQKEKHTSKKDTSISFEF